MSGRGSREGEAAQEGADTRARLIRGFSHDVKNPLGAADGYAQMLEDGMFGPLNEDQQRGIGRIRRSLHAALELVEELADLTRADAGQLELRHDLVDARTIVGEVAGKHRARAENAGLTLSHSEPAEPVMTVTDPVRVRRVLGHLIENATRYAEQGTIAIAVSRATWDRTPRDCVVIDVTDSGPGIPLEERESMFEAYARGGGRRNGIGLGLAIGRRIARALGGDLTVTSAPEDGTTFRLWLPAVE